MYVLCYATEVEMESLMNEDNISSYTSLKVISTVHISQSSYLETIIHTGLQLQFTYLTVSIIL